MVGYSPDEIRALWERYELALRCRERALDPDEVGDQLPDFAEEAQALHAKPAADRDTVTRYIEELTAAIRRATDG